MTDGRLSLCRGRALTTRVARDASYDIYVSNDAGPFSLWLSQTTETSAIYSGQSGHAYAFYSVATDSVGNEEDAPIVADTFTLVDSLPPASSVDALPTTTTTPTFGVFWSGSDGLNGTGIASYDIYVSIDTGPFTLWLDNTTGTSATYSGADSHTYGFFSAATDNVGCQEPLPTVAQAETLINLPDNANAPPTAVTLQNVTTTLPENTSTASAIVLADIVVTDDALGTNGLSLSGADAGAFEIVGTTLRLKAGVVLDYETKSSYAVTVSVDDTSVGSTPDASTSYTLTVGNVNEPPTAVALQNVTTTLPENTSTASAIPLADIVVTDDALGTNGLSLSGTDAGSFEIVGSVLRLKAGVVLNYETKSSYAVTVSVDDPAVASSPDASTNYTLTRHQCQRSADGGDAAKRHHIPSREHEHGQRDPAGGHRGDGRRPGNEHARPVGNRCRVVRDRGQRALRLKAGMVLNLRDQVQLRGDGQRGRHDGREHPRRVDELHADVDQRQRSKRSPNGIGRRPVHRRPWWNGGLGCFGHIRSGPVELDLQYEWDFDGDSQFDDATGIAPIFSAVGIETRQSRTVAVLVTDTDGLTSVATASASTSSLPRYCPICPIPGIPS